MRIFGLFQQRRAAIVIFNLVLVGITFSYSTAKGNNMSEDPKFQVKALLKSIETGETGPASVINVQKYRQHNLAVGDGIAGFAEVLKALPKGSAKVETARVFQDGDYVFAHTEYNFFGPKIGFDIFKFEEGKIVEHWDNLQEKPQSANPSGRTMIDGSVELKDLDKTELNKKLVARFIDDILLNRKMEKLGDYYNGDHYIQHNPHIADGVSGLKQGFLERKNAGIQMSYTKVHQILGEGNFVLVMSAGESSGKPISYYDLFRIESGKIAEHWDTIEGIPPVNEWKNSNGKF